MFKVTRYRVEFEGVLYWKAGEQRVTDRQQVQNIADRILLELTKLAAIEPDVRLIPAHPDEAGINVTVIVEESEVFMASVAGFTQIRTAVLAGGVGTVGWKVDWSRTTTVPTEVPTPAPDREIQHARN